MPFDLQRRLSLLRGCRRARREAAEARDRLLKMGQDLEHSKKRARELVLLAKSAKAVRNEFLSNISHEVRTPMNTIVGMTELALETELSAKQRRYLERVREASDSLLSLLNDLLDLSKIHIRQLHLTTTEFRLRECLEYLIGKFRPRAEKKGLALRCTIAPAVPDRLYGDPGRLSEALGALLSNAVKFTERGAIDVSVEVESAGAGEACLHLTVSDTGIGIPPDQREVIFEEFRQADGSETRRYGGCGIGLTIASQVALLMGGRIWVESEAGQGSRFHMTAHFTLKEAPAVVPPGPAQRPDLRGLKVLLVTSQNEIREAREAMLRGLVMDPTSVADPAAALAALQQAGHDGRPFQLVLLDTLDPRVDGFALAKKIQQAAPSGRQKIIMITSAGERGDAARCRQVGLSGYLTLPLRSAELDEAVSAVLAVEPEPGGQAPLVTRHWLRERRVSTQPKGSAPCEL